MWAYGIAGGFAALLVATATMMIPSLPRAGEMDDAMTAVAPRGGIINRAEYPNEVRDNFEEGEGTLGRLERNEAPVEAPKTAPPPGTPPTAEVAGTILMPEIVEMPQTNQQPPMQSSNRPGTPEPTGPMIIRTVHLTLITKEFDKARSAIDTIVRSASGYVEQLQVRGEIGTGRGLSVTLRVPVDKLDSSLTELRKLGHVQNESQNSADVSSQYVDLEARLKNARNTEQRFLTLLRERTGNLKDVVEAEREIARVREEIERMDAQIKNLSKRVALATIQVDLQEEFRANLESKLPTTGTRISNAAVDGYKRAAETVIGFVMVILMYGPTLLMLAAATVIISLIIWRFMKHRAVKQA
jgi:hypothetical protein